MCKRILLKPGKEKPVLAHHPWIFSGAIARADDARDGDTVDVCDAAGQWLARGYYNSRSQIAVRVWTWNDEPIDRAFLRARLARAIAARDALIDCDATDAYRLVNAESDLLPGLVVDRYAGFVVMQFLTLGVEKRKQELVELVRELGEAKGIYERSDVDVREKEGLGQVVGLLSGLDVPDLVEVVETLHATSPHATSLRILVDVKRGHKTGFYLDQRENRDAVRQHAKDRDVLNAFCYTGAFSVAAWQGGAKSVVSLDSSAPALSLAKKNLELNALPVDGVTEGDVFATLRTYRDSRQSFDMIILDPPKLAHSQSQIEKASRAYKDMNLLALKLLRPGGILITFSCSGSISDELFQKIIFGASLDAKREAQIIQRLSQASDHPVRLAFPEGAYLKGLVCRVT